MAATLAAVVGGAAAWALSVFHQTPLGLHQQQHNITSILGPRLSPSAQIYSPGSEGFTIANDRWITWKAPNLGDVVQVATEGDIEETIRYANEHKRPFLAISGRHGGTRALADVQNGVGIWLRGLEDVTIHEDGQVATVGGGIITSDLSKRLWAMGKQTTVGLCECTGVVGPMLGGGHSWLQGRNGVMADNLVSARLTIANGTTLTVSETSHPDLLWALRGAGHNFGVISSFEYKVYDHTPENRQWAVETMIFSGERLEDVYEVASSFVGGNAGVVPVELVHYSIMTRVPELDHINPVIIFHLIYQGPAVPAKYLDALASLNPLSTQSTVTDLIGLAPLLSMANESPPCAHGSINLRAPVSLIQYAVPDLRRAYSILASLPDRFATSAIVTEAFSLAAKQRVPAHTTAVPDRERGILLSPFLMYVSPAPDEAEGVHAQAEAYAQAIGDALQGETGNVSAYVNYALGHESQEAIYGHEPWRLEKLRGLKREFDPFGRFRFYAPIEA